MEDRWVMRWRTGGWGDGGQVGDEMEDRWVGRWRTGG